MLVSDCVGSSVLSSQGHTLLIGFFGELIWSKPVHGRLYPSLMTPRARDDPVSCAKHRLLVLRGWLPTQLSVCALSQALFPWLVLGLSGEEMEVAGHLSHPNRESLTSRTRCVWGTL